MHPPAFGRRLDHDAGFRAFLKQLRKALAVGAAPPLDELPHFSPVDANNSCAAPAEIVRSAKSNREKRIVADRFADRLPPPGL